MMHTLTLPHQYLLLELDDDSGLSLTSDGYERIYGLAGAVVAELQWRGVLVPARADRFVIREGAAELSGTLARGAAALAGRKPLPLQRCLSKVPARKLREAFLEELVEAGALSRERERYILLFRRTRWRAQPASPEATLIEHLREHVRTTPKHSPPGREDLLLSLLRGTRLLKAVWSPEELMHLKPAIDQCTDRAPIGRHVRKAVLNAHAAAAAAAG